MFIIKILAKVFYSMPLIISTFHSTTFGAVLGSSIPLFFRKSFDSNTQFLYILASIVGLSFSLYYRDLGKKSRKNYNIEILSDIDFAKKFLVSFIYEVKLRFLFIPLGFALLLLPLAGYLEQPETVTKYSVIDTLNGKFTEIDGNIQFEIPKKYLVKENFSPFIISSSRKFQFDLKEISFIPYILNESKENYVLICKSFSHGNQSKFYTILYSEGSNIYFLTNKNPIVEDIKPKMKGKINISILGNSIYLTWDKVNCNDFSHYKIKIERKNKKTSKKLYERLFNVKKTNFRFNKYNNSIYVIKIIATDKSGLISKPIKSRIET